MKKLLYVIVLLAMIPSITGCSVGMALSGKRTPDLIKLEKGQPIATAHFVMRDYVPEVNLGEGLRTEVYTIQLGNAPSVGRAVGHAVLDLLTWGAWELVGTPVEGLSSKTQRFTIVYEKSEFDEWIIKDLQSGQTEGGI